MTPFGLLRVCSAAALAAGSVAVAMPAAACSVSYNGTRVELIGCADEEHACQARGLPYGTPAFVNCVAALSYNRETEQSMPKRRARALGEPPVNRYEEVTPWRH